MTAQTLLREALSLPAPQRAQLAEELLTSLDPTNPALDELWAREAEARLVAFDAGQIEAIPAEEVLGELER